MNNEDLDLSIWGWFKVVPEKIVTMVSESCEIRIREIFNRPEVIELFNEEYEARELLPSIEPMIDNCLGNEDFKKGYNFWLDRRSELTYKLIEITDRYWKMFDVEEDMKGPPSISLPKLTVAKELGLSPAVYAAIELHAIRTGTLILIHSPALTVEYLKDNGEVDEIKTLKKEVEALSRAMEKMHHTIDIILTAMQEGDKKECVNQGGTTNTL